MTTWVNSQFPRPDFHRQVQWHYGLQNDSRPLISVPRSLNGRTAAAEDQRDDEEHDEDKEQDLGDVREVTLKPNEAEHSGDRARMAKTIAHLSMTWFPFVVVGPANRGSPGEIIVSDVSNDIGPRADGSRWDEGHRVAGDIDSDRP